MSAPTWIDLGGIQVLPVSGGKNRMDGGTMLGILPKTIWANWYPADEHNRIELETHCLVVRTGSETYLIESGCGNKLSEKERAFYGVEKGDWILPNLLSAGVDPASIDKVILTHLHTDHAGGVLRENEEGERISTFPNASVFVSQQEIEDADVGYGISPNAYDLTNWRSLLDARRMQAVPRDGRMSPEILCLSTPGHTRGHLSILVEGTHRKILFTGDVLPLARQTVPHFNMSFEVDPVGKSRIKRQILERAFEGDWLLLLSHEPYHPLGKLQYETVKDRHVLVPWDPRT
jgi:glyoxylase-like metal-dependent hydrolase (beta-lactamase superfamily II)